MEKQIYVSCAECGHRVVYDSPVPNCEECGHDWLNADYDLDAVAEVWRRDLISRPFNSMWRYWELLPLKDYDNIVSMGEGGTPLLKAAIRQHCLDGRRRHAAAQGRQSGADAGASLSLFQR
jgi:hypothetical protein